jgi:hypothetical protein
MSTQTQSHRIERTPPPDYSGRRHARITRSMKAVPRSVLPILTELRYSIPDNQTLPISNAALAARTGIGEGFVSAAVRWLAGEAIPYYPQLRIAPRQAFITRQPRSDGQPGYEITMLPPPELRPRPGPRSLKDTASNHPTHSSTSTSQGAPLPFVGDHGSDPLPHTSNSAPGQAKPPQKGDHVHDPPIFLVHTVNQPMNQESPPNRIEGGGGAQTPLDRGESAPAAITDRHTLTEPLHILPGACEENHQEQETLAPELVAGHQALNGERAILPGEWWELLALQSTHGHEQLLIWQARAARRSAGPPSRVLPGYYHTCAARAAVDAYRPRRYERPAPEMAPAPNIKPPAPRLDPACERLLRDMGIREREQLTLVPLMLIEQWATIIEHPGLVARFDDPHAFAHSQLRKHQPPPPHAELDRWAERHRRHAGATLIPALTDAQIAAIEAREAAIEERAAAIAPPDLTTEERLRLLIDLEEGRAENEALSRLHARWAVVTPPAPTPEQVCQMVLEELHQPIHHKLHPLLSRIKLLVAGEELRIVCGHVGDLGTVEAEIAPHVRVALRQYTWQPVVRVVAHTPPSPAPAEPQPPAWIAPERWTALPRLMQTMLLGSTLEDGTVRCVSAGLSRQVYARYGELLTALLAETEAEADHATT